MSPVKSGSDAAKRSRYRANYTRARSGIWQGKVCARMRGITGVPRIRAVFRRIGAVDAVRVTGDRGREAGWLWCGPHLIPSASRLLLSGFSWLRICLPDKLPWFVRCPASSDFLALPRRCLLRSPRCRDAPPGASRPCSMLSLHGRGRRGRSPELAPHPRVPVDEEGWV